MNLREGEITKTLVFDNGASTLLVKLATCELLLHLLTVEAGEAG